MGPQPKTLADVLQGLPDRPAVTVTKGGPSVTRKELSDLAWEVAARLRALGVRPGDLVSIAETNTVCTLRGSSRKQDLSGQADT